MENRKMDNYEQEQWIRSEMKRLESLRRELSRASGLLREETERVRAEDEKTAQERVQFEKEKKEFKTEMRDWTRRISNERKKLAEEQSFFDKKFKILEAGFQQLDADKKTFEAQKRAYEFRQSQNNERSGESFRSFTSNGVKQEEIFFFRGVTHPLALKKRYKDLIKIYHPDNLCGDKALLQQINQEYEKLKKEINYQKKA
jgi:hypothetical protein